MNGALALGVGAGIVGCVCLGTLAGLDAARHMNGVYTAPRPVRWQPVEVAPAAGAPADVDWDQAPVATIGWPDQAGPAERAFFAAGRDDPDLRLSRKEQALLGVDARGRPLPVRVHRAAAHRALPDPPPADPAPAPVEDDLQDLPPTDAALQPEAQAAAITG